MSICILTSMFHNGFDENVKNIFGEKIGKRNKFVFIASEFETAHEKTDKYFRIFLNMFEDAGIHFGETYVIDGRMNEREAQKAVAGADVIWLSGGNTPVQFHYLQKYGLDTILKLHDGVIIGMSAGSINMAETSICTLACGHCQQEIYNGIGCVNISVEPHFIRDTVAKEVLDLSQKYIIYGLCDESIIVCSGSKIEFYGEVYKISQGNVERILDL